MNAIAAKQCLLPHCITKHTLQDCFLAKVWVSRHVKHVSPLYSRI